MKIFIKLGILLAVMLSSLLGIAQSKSDKAYDMFAGKEGVLTFSFSKSALKPFEIFIDDDTKKVIYRMEKVRFLLYNENKGELSALNVYNRLKSEVNGREYFEIDPNELDCNSCEFNNYDNITLYGHGNRYKMDEFHLVIFDDEISLLLSFYGDITVDDLKELGKFSHSTQSFMNP
ncbi:MAG: hypothetical protein ACERKD_23895 [Prolixibacteraceae bacterium]